MKQATRRLQALERVQHRQGEIIPPEQRWWCESCETEEARRACLSEPVTWAEVAADWIAAEALGHEQNA